MFTGIIQAIGTIAAIDRVADSARLSIAAGKLTLDDVIPGDSIAVSGPCMTVVALSDSGFSVDVSTESLERTTLGSLRAGSTVNLEKALRLSDRLGGHLVSGHVDGVGTVLERAPAGDYIRFRITAPAALARYIAEKGSIAVDGVSLTVNAVSDRNFDLMIIPHTLQETTLGELKPAASVNLEIDLVARYIERIATFSDPAQDGTINRELLSRSGFSSE